MRPNPDCSNRDQLRLGRFRVLVETYFAEPMVCSISASLHRHSILSVLADAAACWQLTSENNELLQI